MRKEEDEERERERGLKCFPSVFSLSSRTLHHDRREQEEEDEEECSVSSFSSFSSSSPSFPIIVPSDLVCFRLCAKERKDQASGEREKELSLTE